MWFSWLWRVRIGFAERLLGRATKKSKTALLVAAPGHTPPAGTGSVIAFGALAQVAQEFSTTARLSMTAIAPRETPAAVKEWCSSMMEPWATLVVSGQRLPQAIQNKMFQLKARFGRLPTNYSELIRLDQLIGKPSPR